MAACQFIGQIAIPSLFSWLHLLICFTCPPVPEPIPDDTMVVADIPIDIEDMSNDEMSELEVDNEEDRDYNHNLVHSLIKIFYDDQGEWYEGKVTWFNRKMEKLRVYFEEDESDDYLKESEINGMDIILCV